MARRTGYYRGTLKSTYNRVAEENLAIRQRIEAEKVMARKIKEEKEAKIKAELEAKIKKEREEKEALKLKQRLMASRARLILKRRSAQTEARLLEINARLAELAKLHNIDNKNKS